MPKSFIGSSSEFHMEDNDMKKNLMQKVSSLFFVCLLMFSVATINVQAQGVNKATVETEHNPIIFVHGMYSTSASFMAIENYLRANGWSYDEMYSVELPDKYSYGPVDAAVIEKAVDYMIEKTGKTEVDIVAHSMGGANSLYYILNNNGSDKVQRLVTLGGANRLVTTEAPAGVDVTTISSKTDTIVNYRYLSQLSGANNITITGVSHVQLLFNYEVNGLIKNALES